MFWVWLLIVLKLPMVWIGWVIYRAIKDTPDQVVGDGEGGSGVRFDQGPRKRGPEDPRSPWTRDPRRGDSGHDEAMRERTPERAVEAVSGSGHSAE
ncbi:MAG: hypothetical protein ACRDKI_04915 [Solirubrobacterales bacterium]